MAASKSIRRIGVGVAQGARLASADSGSPPERSADKATRATRRRVARRSFWTTFVVTRWIQPPASSSRRSAGSLRQMRTHASCARSSARLASPLRRRQSVYTCGECCLYRSARRLARSDSVPAGIGGTATMRTSNTSKQVGAGRCGACRSPRVVRTRALSSPQHSP